MNRKQFIGSIMGGAAALYGLSSLSWLMDNGQVTKRMPVMFVGHGTPMNAIQENVFTKSWNTVAAKFPKPTAILCVSAHWLTNGTFVTHVENPVTIHDFGGFPQELFDVQYPAPGFPKLAEETVGLFPSENKVKLDDEWGLDHGTWSVLKHMFPLADVPVLQLSIDYFKPAEYHFELAKYLSKLRERGVLIVGSGNMVHNLRMVAWDKMDTLDYGFDWAIECNEIMKKKISDRDFKAMMNYNTLSKGASLAIPTPDHYYPLMYVLGLTEEDDNIEFFNDYYVAGSLTMTSVTIGL